MGKSTISDATYKRVLDHATSEPSFTAPFLAWDMGVPRHITQIAVARMLRERRVDLIEPRHGMYAAVYAVRPVRHVDAISRPRLALAELDAGIGVEAPKRGDVVPLTGKTIGTSGRPGRDRKKQEAGHRVKRARQGT